MVFFSFVQILMSAFIYNVYHTLILGICLGAMNRDLVKEEVVVVFSIVIRPNLVKEER